MTNTAETEYANLEEHLRAKAWRESTDRGDCFPDEVVKGSIEWCAANAIYALLSENAGLKEALTEFHRLGLVIEGAVRADSRTDPEHYKRVVAAILAARAALNVDLLQAQQNQGVQQCDHLM